MTEIGPALANWKLEPLVADMPRLTAALTLIATAADKAVPPRVSRAAKALVPGSTLIELPDLGHLAHEEAPAQFAEMIGSIILGA